MARNLVGTTQELTDMQRKAVEWDDGPLLVLAGPGSGKTRVLTCRIARLLDESPSERFRILGLTFTNKAAHEMKTRVAALVSSATERVEVNTFHGFCAQLLRQHGVHCGIKPNFEIYSKIADQTMLLKDALRRQPEHFGSDESRFLYSIDTLKKHLVGPDQAMSYLQSNTHLISDFVNRMGVDRIVLAYQLYEKEMIRVNALDFNSLIYLAFKLLSHPVLAQHYRTMYRYWLIDEFQDTNRSQYKLLRQMAGDNFRQLFAVADDDQTIYEWNGANVHRIRSLVDDFGCEVIQLTDNFRCPPGVVEVANRLIAYNVRRDSTKVSARSTAQCSEGEARCKVFSDEKDEASCTATEIACLDASARGKTAVLARSRALLEPVRVALGELNVPATFLGRRDDFASPQMRWFVSCLKQINCPLDRRNMNALMETFRNFADVSLDSEKVIMRSETDQITLLKAWLDAVRQEVPSVLPVVKVIEGLASGKASLTKAVADVMQCFKSEKSNDDLKDDLSAWCRVKNKISQDWGAVPLDRFLQEMELRSKEPSSEPGAVSLSTVHGAKGLEFDRVYLIGMAEDVFPSWHSVKKGNESTVMEEERRSCFVAITRTKKRLVLSRAERYRGRSKKPSRFLSEMGLVNNRFNSALDGTCGTILR